MLYFFFFYYRYGYPRDLHVLTHSFPTRRSSDLEPGHDDDDHRDDLGDRPLDAVEDRLQRRFPRHRGTAGPRRRRNRECDKERGRTEHSAAGAMPQGMDHRLSPSGEIGRAHV